MRGIRGQFLFLFLVSAVIAPIVHAEVEESPLGIYYGEGRVCQGRLRISAKRLDWTWHGGVCRSSYKLLRREPGDGWIAYTLEAGVSRSNCRFSNIVLVEHPGQHLWSVTAYPSKTAYETKSLDEALVCPLIK